MISKYLNYSTIYSHKAYFMHDTDTFSRCVFMCGTGVFHVWYVHSPCMVQAYSRISTHEEVKKLMWLTLVFSMLVPAVWLHGLTLHNCGTSTRCCNHKLMSDPERDGCSSAMCVAYSL